jgi:hypothetical protein
LVRALEGEEGAFGVGHDGEMPAVVGRQGGDGIGGAVGVSRIVAVVIAGGDVIAVKGQREVETAFAMGYPRTKLHAGKVMEENGTVLRNGEREVSGLKLSRPVMEEAVGLLMLGIEEVQLGHELATVADTEAQGVGTGVKPFDGITGLGIVKKRSCPSFGRPEDVGIGKAAGKDDEANVVEGFASGD